ncbi:unnamed protein product [Candidula unifasciata]|uniref:Uncharacterized protein n=1 Tax=Candidula unifasciata TaxID=100452 RepID=A0A8S3Z4Y1_9EUPU|nr:unnamed protein product [Candidula unifasciata]
MSLASRFVTGQTFSKIAHQTNFSCQILDAFSCKLIAPGGFPYEAYNGQACIQPWSVLKMVEYSRAASFANDSFIDCGKIYEKYFVFIASTETRMLPELFDASVKKSPLEIHVKLDYVGNTAFKIKTVISLQGTGILLSENDTQSVCVHKETRKSSPLPDWWKEKFSAANGEPLKLARLKVPESVVLTEQRLQVQASEVDPYMHVNWSNFVKYCHDAFIISQLQSHPGNSAGNLFRNVKNLSASYIKESNLGDFITVRFWQDTDNIDVYKFQILKDLDVLSECCFEYYPDTDL